MFGITKEKELLETWMRFIVIILVFALFSYLLMVISGNKDKPMRDIIIMSFGSISAAMGMIISYVFPSHKKDKDNKKDKSFTAL